MRRRGNCYVTCEALYHLLGGRFSGAKPMHMRYQGESHWFLILNNHVLDPTAKQFRRRPLWEDYNKAVGKGFLTKEPSKRARALMKTMLWQEVR